MEGLLQNYMAKEEATGTLGASKVNGQDVTGIATPTLTLNTAEPTEKYNIGNRERAQTRERTAEEERAWIRAWQASVEKDLGATPPPIQEAIPESTNSGSSPEVKGKMRRLKGLFQRKKEESDSNGEVIDFDDVFSRPVGHPLPLGQRDSAASLTALPRLPEWDAKHSIDGDPATVPLRPSRTTSWETLRPKETGEKKKSRKLTKVKKFQKAVNAAELEPAPELPRLPRPPSSFPEYRPFHWN